MPVCVCPNVKEMGSFSASLNEMNEKMSFKMGAKFAASLWVRIFSLYGMYLYVEVPEVNYNILISVKMNQINKRYRNINVTHRSLI